MDSAYDKICEVIDAVKTDERNEDTDVYALRIVDALTDKDILPLPLWLASEIKSALEGDSNDDEHEALASVAEFFDIPWQDPNYEPSDDEIYNRHGMEGGIAYSEPPPMDEHDPRL